MNNFATMKNINYLLIVFSAIIISSCGYTKSTVNTLYPKYHFEVDTIHSKIIVNKQKKIEGTAVYESVLIFTTAMPSNFADNDITPFSKDLISQLKSAAVWDAVNNNNVELLLYPKFNIIVKETLFTKKIIVKVEGYGGTVQLK